MIDLARYRCEVGSFNANMKSTKSTPCSPPAGSSIIPSTSSSPPIWAGILYTLLLLSTTVFLFYTTPETTSQSKQTTTVSDQSTVSLLCQPLLCVLSCLTNTTSLSFDCTSVLHPQPSRSTTKSDLLPSIRGLFVSDYFLPLCSPTSATLPISQTSTITVCGYIQLPESYQSTIHFWKSRKTQNKLVHALNGNRNENGVKIAHWKAGGKFMENKMHEIESLISQLHPAILGISEINLKSSHDIMKVQLPGYELLTSTTLQNPQLNISRVVVYVKDDLNCKLRPDLMDDIFSSIWIEVKSGRQKFLVANIYRDHQYMSQGADKSSLNMEQQLVRWLVFLEQWQRALATGLEVHTLGDYNLCSLNIHQNNGEKQCLVDALITKILPEGVSQCVRGPTRFPQGAQQHVPAGLDHLWSSAPEKLKEVQVLAQGSSDHSVIFTTTPSNIGSSEKSSVKKRDYSKFNEERFLAEIRAVNWMCVYRCEEVNEATD